MLFSFSWVGGFGVSGDESRLWKTIRDQTRRSDLRHTFASWYMMNSGDLYELAKILGHSNIKMTERYAKLGREHMTKTGTTAKVIWSLMKKQPEQLQEEGNQANIA